MFSLCESGAPRLNQQVSLAKNIIPKFGLMKNCAAKLGLGAMCNKIYIY